MRILTLDPAIKTGWCFGDSHAHASASVSGSISLIRKDESFEQMGINFTGWLNELFEAHRPELVCVEQWMSPTAQKNEQSVVTSLLLHGACIALCAARKIPRPAVPVQTWRKHFIGRASLATRMPQGVKRSSRQKAEDREANKQAVWDRARLLGYLPPDAKLDFDRSDAIGIYDYAAAIYGRAVPPVLTMFEAS